MESPIFNLSFEDYRAHPATSQSTLKAFGDAATPLHFKSEKEKPSTEDQEFGTCGHCATLTPELFNEGQAYHLIPETYPFTPEPTKKNPHPETIQKPWHGGAEYCKKWAAVREGLPHITKDDLARIAQIRERLLRLEPFASALKVGQKEVTFLKEDEDSGMVLKCRADLFAVDNQGVSWCWDLKKVRSGFATEKAFGAQVADLGYNIQENFYRYVTGCSRFAFVVFDDDEPFDAIQYELDAEASNDGWRKWRALLRSYAACVKSGNWPGYSSGLNKLSLPRWAIRENL